MENKVDKLKNVDFEIIWEGQPSGLLQRLLTKLHLNFTYYQITKDELIIKKGFFKQEVNTIELYLLKDPDMTVSLYQRILGIGTIEVTIDTHNESSKNGTKKYLRNVRSADKVRKILRDAIEEDVMERKITYFDKV
ncbi:MAG: PH domain-containing protein [Candidatus Coprovivens sp.]